MAILCIVVAVNVVVILGDDVNVSVAVHDNFLDNVLVVVPSVVTFASFVSVVIGRLGVVVISVIELLVGPR